MDNASVEPPFTVKATFTVVFTPSVVDEELLMVRLLNVVDVEFVVPMVWVDPLKVTVLEFAVKVPLLLQLPYTANP